MKKKRVFFLPGEYQAGRQPIVGRKARALEEMSTAERVLYLAIEAAQNAKPKPLLPLKERKRVRARQQYAEQMADPEKRAKKRAASVKATSKLRKAKRHELARVRGYSAAR